MTGQSPPAAGSRAWARLFLVAAASVVVLLAGAGAFALSARTARAGSSGGEAGLVIQHGDGSVDTYCVGFSGDSVTGDQLLAKAGIPIVQFSGLVCAVGTKEGCFQPHDFASCACQSDPPASTYWAFFTARHDQPWVYSSVGFLAARARDGEMQAWRWGKGGANSAPPPPQLTFEQVCTDRAPKTTTVAPTTAAAVVTVLPIQPGAPSPVPTTAATPAPTSPSPGEVTASPVAATATAPATALITITGHGTATAIPQAPATGSVTGGGAGKGALLGFATTAAVLSLAIVGALIWRRRRGV